MSLVFVLFAIEDTESIEICENENVEYVKASRHTELNIKGKMPLASSEEM